ncbi:MAG: hypothetical protein ABIF71_03085 [Planctomycetota bacterium]
MRTLLISLICVLAGTAAWPADPAPAAATDLAAIAAAVQPGLVQVTYRLRYDKGEAPTGGAWSARCPNCGSYHGLDWDDYVKEERLLQQPGYLVAADRVLTTDIATHPRFIETVRVRFGAVEVPGRIERYAVDQNAAVIALERPLEGAVPLAFDAAHPGPYYAVSYAEGETEWRVTVTPVPGEPVIVTPGRDRVRPVPDGIIVDGKGAAVAAVMNGSLPVDAPWQGSPLDWAALTGVEYEQKLAALQVATRNTVIRVQLNFRSPKKAAGDRSQRRMIMTGDEDGAEEADAAERNATGLVIDAATVLVLADLKAPETARLERVTLHLPDGSTAGARFGHSLRDFGALTVVPERKLTEVLTAATGDIRALRGRLLLAAEVRIKGEERIEYFMHRRIPTFAHGRRDSVYPEISYAADCLYLFTPAGELVVLPVRNRYKGVSEEDRYSYRDTKALPTPLAVIMPALADLKRYGDPSNAPLGEEQENRLAWMGVELQALTRDLARTNNVAKYSKDGRFGAIVSYVYPDSPAARAGIEPGAILLRVHVADEPKPLDVTLGDRMNQWGEKAFPWSQLDQYPEQYFDQLPQPWSDVENGFIRALTDFGFGRAFQAECFIDGAIVQKALTIEQSPPYYAMAPRFKSKELGVTVRDITYEVRRYFQMATDDPGVIISKIETGSKASVAGIKPYEIITHINSVPVADIKQFEANLVPGTELQFSVKRMTQSRVVKVKAEAAEAAPVPVAPPAP